MIVELLYFMGKVNVCCREKYFMIGEANEKREIDEETALEPDPRLVELDS